MNYLNFYLRIKRMNYLNFYLRIKRMNMVQDNKFLLNKCQINNEYDTR